MQDPASISVAIHAVYDLDEESVGISDHPSDAFEAGANPQAMVELLAAVAARANFIAAEVIAGLSLDDDRRKDLVDHFAYLKEQMLDDMLRNQESAQ